MKTTTTSDLGKCRMFGSARSYLPASILGLGADQAPIGLVDSKSQILGTSYGSLNKA